MKKLFSILLIAVMTALLFAPTLTVASAAETPSDANYSVELDDGSEVVGLTGYYKTYAQAVKAINESNCTKPVTVTMLKDMTETETSILTYPFGVNFNGNGKTITTDKYNFICIGIEGNTEELDFAAYDLTVNTAGEGNIFCFRQPGNVVLDNVTVNSTGALRWCVINLNCSGGRVNVIMNKVKLTASGSTSNSNTAVIRTGNTTSFPTLSLYDCEIDASASGGQMPTMGIYILPNAAIVKIKDSTVKAGQQYAIICDREPTLLEINKDSTITSALYPNAPISGTVFTQETESEEITTEAPVKTDEPTEPDATTATPEEETTPATESGCAGVALMAHLVALTAAAVIVIKKKS